MEKRRSEISSQITRSAPSNNQFQRKRQLGENRDNRRPKEIRIDRNRTCPSLIRVLIKENEEFKSEEFKSATRPETTRERHIHHWLDASLREIVQFLWGDEPKLKEEGIHLHISTLYIDYRGDFILTNAATLQPRVRSIDENKTLQSLQFKSGDILTISILSSAPSSTSSLSSTISVPSKSTLKNGEDAENSEMKL
eukprot:TRINITY_DN6670_c0_g1_i1.p1 TRINITY_DN6670_c0_g1~~TRINITY_DN6670_c0_g1_i1.p1  ORF type:complete len:196 (+),score=62.79 TRINITY_DN6670_c0_g1_i1:48-635(+)